MIKIKNIILISLLFVLLLLFLLVVQRYFQLIYLNNRTNILFTILKDPTVLDAEIYGNFGWGIKDNRYCIRILFNDGGSIRLDEVNEKGTGENMGISYVDDYFMVIGNKNGEFVNRIERLQVWSFITRVKLENITDIVKNNHAIRQYVKDVPNIYSYRKEDEIEKVSNMTHISVAQEINSAVINRLIAENIISFIEFNGKEYYMYKYFSEESTYSIPE